MVNFAQPARQPYSALLRGAAGKRSKPGRLLLSPSGRAAALRLQGPHSSDATAEA